MKLLLTGASSFVGAWAASAAVAAGHTVYGLHYDTPLAIPGVIPIQGDLTRISPPPVDAVIHLAAKVMADDALAQNRAWMRAVLSWRRPVVYASSTVVHWPRQNAYARARLEDEARLAASGLPFAIARPCAPYGPPHPHHTPAHGESFHRLARMAARWPVTPLPGGGRALRQPVAVRDFAAALLWCAGELEAGRSGGAWDVGGPDRLRLREIAAALGRIAGRRGRVVPVPMPLLRRVGRWVPGFHPDVLETVDTDDTVELAPLLAASGLCFTPFEAGAVEMMEGLRLARGAGV